MRCLDSSFLIDLSRGDPDATNVLGGHSGELFAPTLALAEVYEGFLRIGKGQEVDTFGWVTPLSFSDAAARRTAEVIVDLERDGSEIPYPDAQIAGTVLSVDGSLVTRDEHFDRVPGLTVEEY